MFSSAEYKSCYVIDFQVFELCIVLMCFINNIDEQVNINLFLYPWIA